MADIETLAMPRARGRALVADAAAAADPELLGGRAAAWMKCWPRCEPCRGSANGPRSTSPCGRCASPTPSRALRHRPHVAPSRTACVRPQPNCWPEPSAGGSGAAFVRPRTSGRPTRRTPRRASMPRPPEALTIDRLATPLGEADCWSPTPRAGAFDWATHEARLVDPAAAAEPADRSRRGLGPGCDACGAGRLFRRGPDGAGRHRLAHRRGRNFSTAVWSAPLCSIPAGETLTYKRLAERIGRPNAVRAVAWPTAPTPFDRRAPPPRDRRGRDPDRLRRRPSSQALAAQPRGSGFRRRVIDAS